MKRRHPGKASLGVLLTGALVASSLAIPGTGTAAPGTVEQGAATGSSSTAVSRDGLGVPSGERSESAGLDSYDASRQIADEKRMLWLHYTNWRLSAGDFGIRMPDGRIKCVVIE
jgi:hypothetical protein